MTDFSIVDSHVHLWDPRRLRYRWLDELPVLNRPFSAADFRAATKGIRARKFVLIEAGAKAVQGWAEVEWATALAASEPRLKGIVAQSTLSPAQLDKLSANPLVKGVRINCQNNASAQGLRRLAKHGFSCDLLLVHSQLPKARRLVENHPDVSFVLDHCGKPDILHRAMDPWRRQIEALSAFPNVVCKLSGLATEADHRCWERSHLKPYIAHALACFGFDRVLFGSDWPVATLATDYSRWVETLQWAVVRASRAQLRQLFQTNAERIYHV